MQRNNTKKEIDFLDITVLLVWLIISIVLGVTWKNVEYFNSTLFATFLGLILPAVYLHIRQRKHVGKIVVGSLLLGALFGFGLEFVAESNDVWSVRHLLFPNKILGIVPIENIIGHISMSFFVFTFYEHFVNLESNNKISKNISNGVINSTLGIIVCLVLYYLFGYKYKFEYAYLVMGPMAVLFAYLIYLKNKLLLKKTYLVFAFFSIYWLLLEISSVHLGLWTFPGKYLFVIDFMGTKVAAEDIFFWVFLYAPTIVLYYEYYIDDMK